MRKTHGTAVVLTLALMVLPGSAQEVHQHGSEAVPPEGTQMMCHQMMGGEMGEMGMGSQGMMGDHDMMNGRSMMGGAGMMSGGMSMMMQSMAGMPGMGMMLGSEPDATMILRAAEELGLDEQQIERLRGLEKRSLEIHQVHMVSSEESRVQASEMLETHAPNLDEYEQALWEAAQHMVTAHLGLVRLSFDARDILTRDQIERLDAGLSNVGPMRCTMMQDGSGTAEGHAEHHHR